MLPPFASYRVILLFSRSSRGSPALLLPGAAAPRRFQDAGRTAVQAGEAGRHARALSAAAGIPVGTVAPCVF